METVSLPISLPSYIRTQDFLNAQPPITGEAKVALSLLGERLPCIRKLLSEWTTRLIKLVFAIRLNPMPEGVATAQAVRACISRRNGSPRHLLFLDVLGHATSDPAEVTATLSSYAGPRVIIARTRYAGVDNGTRTRNILLGRQTLYH